MKTFRLHVPKPLADCRDYPDCGCRKLCDDELRRHVDHSRFFTWFDAVLIVSLFALGAAAIFGSDRIVAVFAKALS